MFKFGKKDRKVMLNNEVVKDKNIQDQNIDMKKDYIMGVLKSKNLPLVILDPLWHTAKEHIQSTRIDQDEERLQALLKERARLNTDYKEYTVVKQGFLKRILELSQQAQRVEDQGVKDEMDCLHQSILGANDKLQNIEERLGTIEDEIQDKNKDIISEMAAIGYGYIETYKKEADELEKEIEALRLEMLKKTNLKKEKETFLKDIYNYLHSIVGREQIEIMDRMIVENKAQEKK